MITDDRLGKFTQSFACYCNQEYIEKELVVITSGSDEYVEGLRRTIGERSDVSVVPVRGHFTLGALRQFSVQHASGPLICQWDDDDYSHPKRLSQQIGAMKEAGARASYLVDNLHYFSDTKKLYWCDWSQSPVHVGHPGTLLAYKSEVPPYNETLDRREDSELQRELMSSTRVALLRGLGHLFIYVFHGGNVFGRRHHAALAHDYALCASEVIERRAILDHVLNEYQFCLKPPIIVSESSGMTVYEWNPRENAYNPGESAARCSNEMFVV
jgi:glycosyltransferase involved in cell wall biosynthesis